MGLARLVLCGSLLVGCAPWAVADSVGITGNVAFNHDSLTFAPPFTTQGDSGIFAPFASGNVNYMLGTVAYMDGFYQTSEAFTITNAAGDELAFYAQVNDPHQSLDANGRLQITLDETGYYTFNGGPQRAGVLDFNFTGTSADGSSTYVPFTATGSLLDPAAATGVTPEPGSILLLGTGLLGCAAVLRRRRA